VGTETLMQWKKAPSHMAKEGSIGSGRYEMHGRAR
jgi:hypothetical protein